MEPTIATPIATEAKTWIDLIMVGGPSATILVLIAVIYFGKKYLDDTRKEIMGIAKEYTPQFLSAIVKLTVQMEKQNDLCENMIDCMKEHNKP